MMIIGASLAVMDVKRLFTDGKLLAFSVIKLLLVPIAGLFIIARFVENPVILGVCMVMLATPVGSMNAMLAQQYDGITRLPPKGLRLTTILSVATMPLIAALML